MKQLFKPMLIALPLLLTGPLAAADNANRAQKQAEMRERWESMSEAERQAVRERRAAGRMGSVSEEQREAMRERWHSMSEEERQAARERWQSMSDEERRAMRESRGAARKSQG